MNTRRVNVVADAICRAQSNGTVTPAGIAMALESACLLQSPESVSLSGLVCSQADARAAGLDVAPSVVELTAMAESVVALGDPLSAGVDLARAVPLLGAEVERLRARVAEQGAELERVRAERNEFCDRVDTLTAVAQGNKRHVQDMFAELQTAQRQRAEAEARVAELEENLRAVNAGWSVARDRIAVLERTQDKAADLATEAYASRPLPPRDAVCARPGCGHTGEEHHHGDTKCWAHLPKRHGDPIAVCGCEGFVPSLEDPHDSPLHHDYRKGRGLPETGGAS